MLVYLVCEELFSPRKSDTLAIDRFVSLLQNEPADAVLIANETNQFRHEIDGFINAYGDLVHQVVESEMPVRIGMERFHLRSTSLLTNRNEIIHAVDDSVCEIRVEDDGSYQYRYLALDLFDSSYFDQLINQAAPKHIVIPFQDILKFLEQNMDEETAEILKKAKADFYYKTKS